MSQGNSFPLFYVPWNDKKEYFQTGRLDEVQAIKSIIDSEKFYPVSFKNGLFLTTKVHKELYRSTYYKTS